MITACIVEFKRRGRVFATQPGNQSWGICASGDPGIGTRFRIQTLKAGRTGWTMQKDFIHSPSSGQALSGAKDLGEAELREFFSRFAPQNN